jgi:RNA polymerase sigma factor (sigma-70 family)
MKEDKPMAKAYRIPDYKKMYPEAGEEVIAVLRTTERKMQYQEYDLKTEQTVINQEDQTITTIPSREDSLERLAEQEVQFAADTEGVEETVLRRLQYAQLHKAISLLSDDERELVDRLFFQGQTEREAAAEMGIYRNAVHKRKNRILEKLKNFLENF